MSQLPAKKSYRIKIIIVALVGALLFTTIGQAAPGVSPASFAAAGLQLSRAGTDFLEIDWITPDFTIKELILGGQACQILSAAEMVQSSTPGHPQLPVKGALIGIPADAALSIEIVEMNTATAPGRFSLCPAGQPVLSEEPDGSARSMGELFVKNEQVYQADGFIPDTAYQISPAGKIRSQHIAHLLVQPFRYNPASGELQYVTKMRIRLNFKPEQGSDLWISGTPADEGYFEPALQLSLLNYDQALAWRDASAPVVPSRFVGLDSKPSNYKILVDADGIYRLDYPTLQAANVPVDSLDPRTFTLTNQGQQVHIYVSGEADGIFDSSDSILFYGQQARTRFTNQNVYWLSWGAVNGLRMGTLNGAPGAQAVIPEQYLTVDHLEKDVTYQSARPSGPDNDRWYWTRIQNPPTSSSKVDFIATTTLANLSTQTVNARLRGLFRSYSGTPQNWTRVYVNGSQVDENTWPAGSQYSFDVSFPQSYLLEGENSIRVEAVNGNGITQQTIFINWLEIEYYDRYIAENNSLYFDGDSAGTWEFHVNGFSTNDIQLFDLTVPSQPKRILNPVVNDAGGTYEMVFTQTISGESHYLALSPTDYSQPLAIEYTPQSSLHSTQNGADYLMITHPDFISQAQRLVDQRTGLGYRSKLVNVQDIYDEFSDGLFDPTAIHSFLSYAYLNWQPPAPTFVVLFGDGNYDFKNNIGFDEQNYIPPYLANVDPYIGETAADNRYVMISGSDILPDMHIGRLTAKTLADATAMVDKIIGYETTRPADFWFLNTVFVADDNDPDAGNFPVLADGVIASSLPNPYSAERIYYKITHPGVDDVTQGLIAAVNEGALLVSYIGHASVQWWAYEQLFNNDDVASFNNPDRLALFLSMTCQDGYFINPSGATDASALAEVLLRSAAKGAIASWSPSGLGVASGHDILEKGLLDALLKEDVFEIGAAVTQSKYGLYATSSAFRDLIDTYVLFGDPATPLNSINYLAGEDIYLPLVSRK